jgi:spore coat polysaccharide biosynthesis predicted glycosyltransferase SpsG
MKKVDVCLVAIGTRSTGYGHITRTIEIFDVFRARAKTVCLIRTDEEGLQLVPSIPGLHAVTSDQDLLKNLAKLQWRLVACDFLEVSAEVMSMITNNSPRIASVSPISTVNELADVIITRIPVNGPIKGVNLHGSRFAIANSRKNQDDPQRLSVGINFGGSDPEDQLTEFVRGISKTDCKVDLAVVLGPGYRGSFSRIFDSLIENPNIDFSVNQSASRFWEILECQDVLVLSDGMALYESIRKSVPAIAFLPAIDRLRLIPDDLKQRGVPWITHTVSECITKLEEIYIDRQTLEQQKLRLSGVDFSCNTEYLVGALASYVE